MNFSNLDYFLVVAEELNITKAAERLYISQQSLSNQIIKLEKTLGVQLFIRTPSFHLTYAGTRLKKAASKIMDIYGQLLSEMEDIKQNKRGIIKVGVSHTRGRVLLPKILPEFEEKYPQVEISLIEGNSETLENLLRHGEIDVALSFFPRIQDGITSLELLTDKLYLVVHKRFMQDKFKDKIDYMRGKFSESADIAVFSDCPFLMLNKGNRIRTLMDAYFEKNKISPNIILETENTETAFALALTGVGITVYPEMFLRNEKNILTSMDGEVDFFPLTAPETYVKLAVSFSQNRYLSHVAKDFVRMAVSKLSPIANQEI